MSQRLGTAQDVAAVLGVTPARVYELARARLIPGVVRLGRQVRFDLGRIDTFIEAGGQALEGGWRRSPSDFEPTQL